MAKYYTVCEATPSIKQYRNNSYLRLFKPVCEGFLFHDSEKTIGFDDIRKAVWGLSSLFEGARTVIAVRVDAKTIMATFDTRALPKPSVYDARGVKSSTEYLADKKLSGWILPDIHDQESEAKYLIFNELYEACTMLERFTDNCPCPRLAEGTCLPDTAYAILPWLAERVTAFAALDSTKLKTAKYKNLHGFEYITGQTTARYDFTEAVRPWDDHDFEIVETRKRDFAERGAEASHRHAHRKTECAQCTFATTDYKGIVRDCGQIRSCVKGSTEQEAWDACYHWFTQTPFFTGNGYFTVDQIDYLITLSGEEHESKALGVRKIPTYLAGFTSGGDFRFKVVPTRGRLNRSSYFYAYHHLREAYPHLPEPDKVPKVSIKLKTKLAYAIFSKIHTLRESGHQPHPAYRIQYYDSRVELWGYTSVSSFEGFTLRNADSVMNYIHYLYPSSYHRISGYPKTLWPTEQSLDTPQLPQLVQHP